jgi:hypothetical protein
LRAAGIPLVGLGRPGEAIGAGRYMTDDVDWQSVFEPLASAASGIIVVPSLTSGTRWEIEWIVQNKMLNKTLFIYPQHVGKRDAKLLADEYRNLGLQFPDDGSGCILKMGTTGEVIARFDVAALSTGNAGLLIQNIKLYQGAK